jgi:hypothetical protein
LSQPDDFPFAWKGPGFLDARPEGKEIQSEDTNPEPPLGPISAVAIGQRYLVKPDASGVDKLAIWIAHVCALPVEEKVQVWWMLPFVGNKVIEENNVDGGKWEKAWSSETSKPMKDTVFWSSLDMVVEFTSSGKITTASLKLIHARLAQWKTESRKPLKRKNIYFSSS